MTQETLPVAVPIKEQVADALRSGGRARVTVTSKATGRHLTVRLACKMKGDDGRWVSRARLAGRVGIDDADAVFADGGDDAFAGWVATLYTGSGSWFTPKVWDDPRGEQYFWVAQRVVAWALGGFDLEEQADVALAEECSVCGRGLTDPESIARGIGPECFGRRTESSHV
jgi:hypothetical protein